MEVDEVHEERKSGESENEKDQWWDDGGDGKYKGRCEPNGGG